MKSNHEFSKIFKEFAELLELKGEIPFKIIAYQKASASIDNLSEQVSDIYQRGGVKALEQIEGIGEGIAEKIEEEIKHGKIKELESLRKKIPRSEIEFLKIPGVGPATAKVLYKKFGDIKISELATKLSREGLEILKPKSLKKILQGVEIYKNLGDRMMIDEALTVAEPLVKFLKESCQAQKAVAVGSLRRCKDTIGDIDIICSSKNAQSTIEEAQKYKGFEKILSKGNTKLTAMLENGKEVDIEILPEGKYGSLLLHFTGSKQHNVHLRSLAQKKGLSLSEHGIRNEETSKLILFPEEADVYKYLGLDFIEPELREDRGEIEAAEKHILPNLVNLSDIKGDIHIHSTWSDGISTIKEIAIKAKKLNYQYIGIADHAANLKNHTESFRNLNTENFKKRLCEIEKTSEEEKIKIFNCAEVSIKPDGALELRDEDLKKFDLVIASIHTVFDQPQAEVTRRLIKAIENPYVRIIAHPAARKINKRPGISPAWQEIFKACKQNDVALEINSFPIRLDLLDYLVLEAKKFQIKFFISTDAHSAKDLDLMKFGLTVARRGWCEKKNILNTLDLNELNRWLGR